MNDDDLDDTARLILMEKPDCSMREFADMLRREAFASLTEIGQLWRRYRGFDGRIMPTHDVQTGARR